jgi:Pyruvate/2-oxoacid:ferredoxin oxidoreductase delta subunit
MSKSGNDIGVVLACGGRFAAKERERIAGELGSALLVEEAFGSPRQLAALATRIAKRRFARVLLAGVAPAGQAELVQALQARLPGCAVAGVDLGQALASRGRAAAAIRAIRKGLAALAEVPPVERRSLSLEPGVLVVGGGPAGRETAAALIGLGHPVTIVEQKEDAPRGTFDLKGAMLLAGSKVRRVEGQVGGFAVSVRTPSGDRRVACGAVVLAAGVAGFHPGIPAAASGTSAAGASGFHPGAATVAASAAGAVAPVEAGAAGLHPYDVPGVLPLEELEAAVARLPRRRGVRSAALILDWRIDETKGSTQGALELALKLQRDQGLQVHLFCRDIRVGAMELEVLYDRTREAGVDIVKFEGGLNISAGPAAAVTIRYRDAILGQEVSLECALVGVSSYGVHGAADPELARLFGVSLDALGQLQPNNIHLFPGETNRPGIFAAGACRGQYYLPRIASEARATALAVHQLLAPGVLEVELAQAVVDEDKCALCLTCVRSCPHGAMYVDRAKGAAASAPEACRRCGICAGECPAKAITLPAWSDRAVLSQVR